MMNDLPSLNKHLDISLPIDAKQKARLLMIEEKNPPHQAMALASASRAFWISSHFPLERYPHIQ